MQDADLDAIADRVVAKLMAEPMQLRDAYQASRGKPADRPLKFRDAFAALFNYESMNVRELAGDDDPDVEAAVEKGITTKTPSLVDRIWARKATGTDLGTGDILGRLFNRGGSK